MKNFRFICALALALSCTAISAQLSVGGIIGMNIANVNVDPEPSSEDYSARLGLMIGAVVEFELTENLSARAEPMIMGKGATIKDNGDEAKFRVSYLEIPLLIKYDIELASQDFTPYVLAGPSIGFLTSAKAKFDGNSIDIKDETKGVDFSITFGAGAEMPLGRNFTPFVELRYALGLANVNSEVDDDPDESTVKNRGFVIAVGATVPLDTN